MEAVAEKIREIAKRLLSEGKVDCVVGYEKGTVPMRERPFFAYTPEEASRLTWSRFCCNNLANLLIRRPKGETGKVAVVAQGCVSRNLVGLIQENQLNREDLFVIGVNSPGMVDRNKVLARFPGRTITEVEEQGEDLLIKGPGLEEKVPIKEVKRDNCYTCIQRNPVIVDEWASEEGEKTSGGNIDNVAAPWEKLDSEERYQKFLGEIVDKCIRCYACRDACPLCYCHVCFVDESQPQWCGKTQDDADVASFHILRAFHCAGRCTDCGACESACPQGIKMRRLTSKIEKDIREMYGYSAGMELDATPPMSVYRPDDPQEFIK
jgi:ferredoxin